MKTYKLDGPTRVTIEASLDTIIEHDLNTLEGEQYDVINDVISIVDDGQAHTFTTCRSVEAWKRGEPNAGRGTWVIPNSKLHKVHLPDDKE